VAELQNDSTAVHQINKGIVQTGHLWCRSRVTCRVLVCIPWLGLVRFTSVGFLI